MKKWEYLCVDFLAGKPRESNMVGHREHFPLWSQIPVGQWGISDQHQALEDILCRLGADGYELVNIIPVIESTEKRNEHRAYMFKAVFKRPVEN